MIANRKSQANLRRNAECFKKETLRQILAPWTTTAVNSGCLTSRERRSGYGSSLRQAAAIEPATVTGTVTTILTSPQRISRSLASTTGTKNQSENGSSGKTCPFRSCSTAIGPSRSPLACRTLEINGIWQTPLKEDAQR